MKLSFKTVVGTYICVEISESRYLSITLREIKEALSKEVENNPSLAIHRGKDPLIFVGRTVLEPDASLYKDFNTETAGFVGVAFKGPKPDPALAFFAAGGGASAGPGGASAGAGDSAPASAR